jgi:DTW domain-containing protein YfiP
MLLRDQRRAGNGHRPRIVCYRCFKPQVACICASIEPVGNRTGVIILQHPRERFHAIGTVRIVRLALENVRIEPCSPWVDSSAIQARLPERSALLYPTADARELATLPVAEHPRHLVVLDGTWFHAKKLYDAHRWLHPLPHVRLTPSTPSGYRIRPEPRRSYVATLEAIVCALRIIEPQTRGLDALLRSFAAMVDWQAAYTPAAVRG